MVIWAGALVMCHGLALAESPAPSQAPQSFDKMQGFILAVGVGLMAFLAKLVSVLSALNKAGRGYVRDANILNAADDKAAKIPQPLVTATENPPVGKREFDLHRERNTIAHDQFFTKLRDLEEKLRKESEARNVALLEKLDDISSELRSADEHNTGKLSTQISGLISTVGELRGTVETMMRQKTRA